MITIATLLSLVLVSFTPVVSAVPSADENIDTSGEPPLVDNITARNLSPTIDDMNIVARGDHKSDPGDITPDLGRRICGMFPNGDRKKAGNQMWELNHKNDGYYQILANQCLRVRCGDTTGIYVCNVSLLGSFPLTRYTCFPSSTQADA